MYVGLTEMMAFQKPKGLEDYRFYRIEYGGPNKDCIYEGAIWVPSSVDVEEIEKLLDTEEESVDDEVNEY